MYILQIDPGPFSKVGKKRWSSSVASVGYTYTYIYATYIHYGMNDPKFRVHLGLEAKLQHVAVSKNWGSWGTLGWETTSVRTDANAHPFVELSLCHELRSRVPRSSIE